MKAETPRPVMSLTIKPINLEIYWKKLMAIAHEAGPALKITWC